MPSPLALLDHRVIVGFHGCDQATADRVLVTGEPMKPSGNQWDWLGEGIYLFPVGIADGAWTADGCYLGLWPDGSNSAAFGWCLGDGAVKEFGAPVYVPGSMGFLQFAVSPSEGRVAVAERRGRLAEFDSGRDSAPERNEPLQSVPAWPADGEPWRVRSIAYDAAGALVSLVCDQARSRFPTTTERMEAP